MLAAPRGLALSLMAKIPKRSKKIGEVATTGAVTFGSASEADTTATPTFTFSKTYGTATTEAGKYDATTGVVKLQPLRSELLIVSLQTHNVSDTL